LSTTKILTCCSPAHERTFSQCCIAELRLQKQLKPQMLQPLIACNNVITYTSVQKSNKRSGPAQASNVCRWLCNATYELRKSKSPDSKAFNRNDLSMTSLPLQQVTTLPLLLSYSTSFLSCSHETMRLPSKQRDTA